MAGKSSRERPALPTLVRRPEDGRGSPASRQRKTRACVSVRPEKDLRIAAGSRQRLAALVHPEEEESSLAAEDEDVLHSSRRQRKTRASPSREKDPPPARPRVASPAAAEKDPRSLCRQAKIALPSGSRCCRRAPEERARLLAWPRPVHDGGGSGNSNSSSSSREKWTTCLADKTNHPVKRAESQ